MSLYSRPGNDLTHRFPLIVETLARLRSRSYIIDGEAVACDDSGVTSFNLVRYRHHDESIFLYAFDVIELSFTASIDLSGRRCERIRTLNHLYAEARCLWHEVRRSNLIYAILVNQLECEAEAAMDQDGSEITEQVIKFPPKQQSANPADEAGQAVIAQIRKAAQLANENCDRAMALAHKLAMQLRAAEDKITQLEAEVAVFRDRTTRAEGWLQTIHSEIEQKLIAPTSAFRTEQVLVSSNSKMEPSQPPVA